MCVLCCAEKKGMLERALSSKEDFLDILYGVKSDGVKR